MACCEKSVRKCRLCFCVCGATVRAALRLNTPCSLDLSSRWLLLELRWPAFGLPACGRVFSLPSHPSASVCGHDGWNHPSMTAAAHNAAAKAQAKVRTVKRCATEIRGARHLSHAWRAMERMRKAAQMTAMFRELSRYCCQSQATTAPLPRRDRHTPSCKQRGAVAEIPGRSLRYISP